MHLHMTMMACHMSFPGEREEDSPGDSRWYVLLAPVPTMQSG